MEEGGQTKVRGWSGTAAFTALLPARLGAKPGRPMVCQDPTRFEFGRWVL